MFHSFLSKIKSRNYHITNPPIPHVKLLMTPPKQLATPIYLHRLNCTIQCNTHTYTEQSTDLIVVHLVDTTDKRCKNSVVVHRSFLHFFFHSISPFSLYVFTQMCIHSLQDYYAYTDCPSQRTALTSFRASYLGRQLAKRKWTNGRTYRRTDRQMDHLSQSRTFFFSLP